MQTGMDRKTAVLLVNLGTPDAPTAPALRRYLREFLSDPRVVEIPRAIWWFILNLIIVPLRSPRSARTYQTIWTDRGSPLSAHSTDLGESLQEHLEREFGAGEELAVYVAMRYGNPSVHSQLQSIRQAGFDRLLILPLYPQYSAATTASTFDAVVDTLRGWRHIPELHFISDYHCDPGYIDSVATSIGHYWKTNGPAPMLLFSFHGLPARSRALGDPYYDQCQETASLVARKLGLEASRWQVVFQSRFGPAEWLKPYCVDVLASLPGEGKREVDVVCPGFAVDCLETLEEIAIANREVFLHAGGTQYRYIPALNSSPVHASLLAGLIRRTLPSSAEKMGRI